MSDPKDKTIGIKVSADQLSLIKAAADQDGTSPATWVRMVALREARTMTKEVRA